jgi:GTP-binding protein
MVDPTTIRNVAIIAHVDHGKTTLVDGLLRQSHALAEHGAEAGRDLVLDSGDLERERGITIAAKTTAVEWRGHKVNIIDTPGHADFSGEVERTLHLADGCLLIVDAQEGPMPQTRFVLAKALALGLRPILVVNKIDKRDARPDEALEETTDLFLDLVVRDDQLEFPVLWAVGREGRAWTERPDLSDGLPPGDLTPLFDAIVDRVPAPGDPVEGAFQLLVTALDHDPFRGRYAVGRIRRGIARPGMAVAIARADGTMTPGRVEAVFVSRGLQRVETDEAPAGDVVQLTGLPDARIGETVADAEAPEALPSMEIEPPTLQVELGPNTSPFSGREGRYTTSRQIAARLVRELETNVALRVEERDAGFLVSGRGELHLSVLIETLRREGYEFEVGRPRVVTHQQDGRTVEPVEEVTVEVPEEYVGAVTAELGRRRARTVSMQVTSAGATRMRFIIPTRTLLGARALLLTATRGTMVMHSVLAGYEALGPAVESDRNGALVSFATGTAYAYGLEALEERGTAFIGPGTEVYEGMVIGLNRRHDDLEINVCKQKHATNIRSSTKEQTTTLTPHTELSLEQALDFIGDDELLEVTPEHLRIRKRLLRAVERRRGRAIAVG